MMLIPGFDEKAFYRIAKECRSRQLEDDVKYMRLVIHGYKSADRVCAERLDDKAFWIGYNKKDHMRLVGIGVKEQYRGQGFGRFMLKRAIERAKANGYSIIRTRTASGADFYQKYGGAKIVGIKGNDYLMEMYI